MVSHFVKSVILWNVYCTMMSAAQPTRCPAQTSWDAKVSYSCYVFWHILTPSGRA